MSISRSVCSHYYTLNPLTASRLVLGDDVISQAVILAYGSCPYCSLSSVGLCACAKSLNDIAQSSLFIDSFSVKSSDEKQGEIVASEAAARGLIDHPVRARWPADRGMRHFDRKQICHLSDGSATESDEGITCTCSVGSPPGPVVRSCGWIPYPLPVKFSWTVISALTIMLSSPPFPSSESASRSQPSLTNGPLPCHPGLYHRCGHEGRQRSA